MFPESGQKRLVSLVAAKAVIHQRIPPQGTFPVDQAADMTIPNKNVAVPQIPVDQTRRVHLVKQRFFLGE